MDKKAILDHLKTYDLQYFFLIMLPIAYAYAQLTP